MQANHLTRDEYAMNHPAGRIGKRLMLRVADVMLRCAWAAGWAVACSSRSCSLLRWLPCCLRNPSVLLVPSSPSRLPLLTPPRPDPCSNGKVPVVTPDTLMPQVLVELSSKGCVPACQPCSTGQHLRHRPAAALLPLPASRSQQTSFPIRH